MVRRIAFDFVRRQWRGYATILVILLLAWAGGPPVWRASDATLVAVAMTAAFCLGPVLTGQFVRREVFLMPVSTRQLWLARWWLATVGAATVVVLPNLLVPRASTALTLAAALCALAYNGVYVALLPLLNARPRGSRRVRVAVLRGQAALGLFTGLGGFAWAFLLRPWLPTAPEHLAGPAGFVLGAALLVTLAGYLHVPGPEVPALMNRRAFEAAGREHASTLAMPPRPRLTGVRYLLWRDAAISLVYAGTVMAVLAALSVVTETGGPSAHIRRVTLSVMPGPGEPLSRLGWLVLLLSCAPAGLLWQNALRHVRALPLSAFQVSALLAAVALSRWLAFWLLAALLASLDSSVSVVFRPDALLAFVGIGSAVQAAGLRWTGTSPARLIIGASVTAGLVIGGSIWLADVLPAAAAAVGASPWTFVGLITLASAVLLNLHTLTRRSATFRRPDQVLPGLSAG